MSTVYWYLSWSIAVLYSKSIILYVVGMKSLLINVPRKRLHDAIPIDRLHGCGNLFVESHVLA